MSKAPRIKKTLIFALTGGGAYVALFVLGHGDQAWQTLTSGLVQQLQFLLSAAVGGAFALLLPITAKKTPGDPPISPDGARQTSGGTETKVPLWDNQAFSQKLDEWQAYGQEADKYMQRQDKARALLDIKQTVLRISLFAMVGLSLLVCVFGFWAPSIATLPSQQISETVFLSHLGYTLIAFAITGFVTGAVVHRVRVHTRPRHAFRCALITAMILSLGSLLISLPYVFARMWAESLTVGSLKMPMLLWMAVFRIVAAPLTCAVSSYVGFWLAHFFGSRLAREVD